MKNNLKVLFILAVGVWACDPGAVHKDLAKFDDYKWAADDIKKFEFEIKDNTEVYQLNYLLRNAINYPFYNIYLKTWLRDSTGQDLKSGMEEVILFDEKTGKPFGDGLGDLFDPRVTASQYRGLKFPYAGKYTFEMQQNMRPDPLVGILSIGFEIVKPESAGEKK